MDIQQAQIVEPFAGLTKVENPAGIKDQEQLKKAAKGFEEILIYKLMEDMNKTIGDWGFEKDGASTQVQSLFSMCLSQHLSNNGGLGLWEQIYKSMKDSQEQISNLTIQEKGQ
jgi:Rod binding domain-containing protein